MKNGKKRNIKIFLATALLCIIAIWAYYVYKVNHLIPQVKTVTYEANEWVEWKDDVQVNVKDAHFMYDEAIRNGEKVEERMLYPFEIRILWVTVSLKNDGTKPADVYLLELGGEASGCCNIPDLDFYYALGDGKIDTHFELQPDEQVTVDLPYSFVKPNFRNSEWKRMEEKDYFITMSLYPVKRSISVPKPA